MPPYRIKVYCLDCAWRRQGWNLQTLSKADKHGQTTGHMLEYYRVTSNTPGTMQWLGLINSTQQPEIW